jgi:hypothetical protein
MPILPVLCALVLAAPPKIVSPEWHSVNVGPKLTAYYAHQLATALRAQGLEVVTSEDMSTLLGIERQKALAGCSEGGSCMVELANALGADAALVVSLARFESGAFQGVATLVSASTGKTLVEARLDSKSEEELIESIDAAAETLASPWGAAKTSHGSRSITRYGWAPVIAGVVVGAVGAGLLVGANLDANTIRTTNDAGAEAAAFANGPRFQIGGWVAVGVGAALIVGGIVMALWPRSHVAPIALITPQGATFGLGGRF